MPCRQSRSGLGGVKKGSQIKAFRATFWGYGQRENGIEEGEGASERTKYQELVQKITVANTIEMSSMSDDL